jgi:type II secretory ATPase GspE/PulE/Tfp pilus assembly ATPase PilB-like protein
METVIEGRWKRRPGARLHVAPQGMTLVDDTGGVVGTVAYREVTGVYAGKERRRSLLTVELGERGAWQLDGLHPLQARFAAELIQEQLSALHRRTLPLYAEPQPLAQVNASVSTLLASSPRGVVDALDFLLAQAAHHRASDIHIEPFPTDLRVRYRLDGVLADVAQIPLLWQPRLFARLKILADLAIYRQDVPQEGRLAVHMEDRTVDVRATLLPTLHGEKAVLRLFDPARSLLSLEQLGMSEAMRGAWERLLQQPQGMLLLTGPSNHGKTTTLYASLAYLHANRRDLSNLCTVEDPVEYDLRVVNQTQVNNAVGLTFANGLRTVLRQDPEVIMIGEIRDEETAGIAVRAGLTGHLILSTVHAPSAAGVFARLVDLDTEPFLVASAVSAVLAQRLVRTICPDCREPAEPGPLLRERLGLQRDEAGDWSRGAGCAACAGTGYRGRTGVFQLLEVNDAVREGVLAGKTTGELERLAGAADGLRSDALAKAAAGLISLDEVSRVLGGA